MADWLSLDFETRSVLDLRKTGVHKYAQHKHTDVWCLAWALDDGPINIWVPGEEPPVGILEHICVGGNVRAWNAAFERTIWNNILVPRYGFPVLHSYQVFCTAAQAAAMALPRSLDQAATALGTPLQKDKEGAALMLRMARPRRMDGDTPVWWDVPDRVERLIEYCKTDVAVERMIATKLRPLGTTERQVYLLDQQINDKGVMLDKRLVDACLSVVADTIMQANARLHELTDGQVSAVTNTGRLRELLGVETLAKAAVKDLLDTELSEVDREILTIRQEAGKSSTAKLHAMLEACCDDGRIRGLLLYHGATTGRWAGRLVQPQNFPRGLDGLDVDGAIDAVFRGDVDLIDMLYGPPMEVVSTLLRPCLVAAPGNKFISADYAAIEARVLAWLANETELVETFRVGGDVYKVMASKIYGVAPGAIDKPQRQMGKMAILGCGYGMGSNKFISACKTMAGIEIDETTAKDVVSKYREANGNIVRLWRQMEQSAIEAVQNPGQVVSIRNGKVRYVVKNGFLWMVLPSGRPLAYAKPRVFDEMMPWGSTKPVLYFDGVGLNNQWTRQTTYGGKLTENLVQAVARDLLAEAMLRLNSRGYPLVLSVHDELVAEVKQDFGSVEEFENIMCELPSWAAGCPVDAEGWEGVYYRK
jgi:DNA polymerase